MRTGVAGLAAIVIATQAVAAESAGFVVDGHLSWLRDEATALAQAKALHRPVIVDFYADWCSSCMELDHKTYSDPRVRDAIAARLVPLKIDCTDDTPRIQTLEKKYGVDGLPTVLFLDADGHSIETARLTEYVAADAFLARLAKIR